MKSSSPQQLRSRWLAAGVLLSLVTMTACGPNAAPGISDLRLQTGGSPQGTTGSAGPAGSTGSTGNMGSAGNTGSGSPIASTPAPIAPTPTPGAPAASGSDSSGTGNTVSSTLPASAALKVVATDKLVISFNRPMDPATINTSTLLLSAGAFPVPGTVTYSGETATFAPTDPLSSDTVYTASLTTDAKDMFGIGLAADHVWDFTTAIQLPGTSSGGASSGGGGGSSGSGVVVAAPTVASVTPLDTSNPTPRNQVVKATFSTAMNEASVTASFTLKPGVAPAVLGAAVPGATTFNGTTMSFTPTASLTASTAYTATLTTGAQNLAGTPVAANLVWTFTTGTNDAQLPFTLGAEISKYVIFAHTAVTNTLASEIRGDLGVTNAYTSITGFQGGPGIMVSPSVIRSTDFHQEAGAPAIAAPITAVNLAKGELEVAYDALAARLATTGPVLKAGNLGSTTLGPDLYKATANLSVTGGTDLTLDGQGDPNSVFIFQVPSSFTLTMGNGSKVLLTNGAKASNVFWQVSDTVIIGTTVQMAGNIVAHNGVTIATGSTLNGRAMGKNAAVTLQGNMMTKPTP